MPPLRRSALLLVVVTSACASPATPSSTTASTTAAAPSAAPVTAAATSAVDVPATTASKPATASVPTSAVQPGDALRRWTEDVRALDEGLRRLHPNPFWRQPEAEFAASLAAAPETLAALGDSDARAEVMRLAARIDGHTGVYLGEAGFHLYALHLYAFGDDLAVIAGADPALFGAKVVSVGGVPTAAAVAAVRAYSPFDNAETVRLVVPTLMVTPEVLHAAGVVRDTAAPHYRLRLTDGTERTVDPEQLTWEASTRIDPRPIGMTRIASIPSLARIDEPFWTTIIPRRTPDGHDTLYLQYNEVVARSGPRSIDELARDIDTTLAAGAATRLVIDLRYNPGGNDLTYPPLLRTVTTNPALARPGALVVLIGRQSFSAAVLFAAELDRLTKAVFVGEPTGGSPSLYANPRPVVLPNSRIVVQVSSKRFGAADDRRDAIEPDLTVTAGLDDLLAGREPVLDAALTLP